MFTTPERERLRRGLAAANRRLTLTLTLHSESNGSALASGLEQVALVLRDAAPDNVKIDITRERARLSPDRLAGDTANAERSSAAAGGRAEPAKPSPALIEPCLTIIDGAGRCIRYAALPAGPEAPPFIAAVLALAGAEPPTPIELEPELARLAELTDLLVLIAPGCVHCPRAVDAAMRLAIASPRIRATIVDAMAFSELAQQFAVKSVPVTIINDGDTVIGVIGVTELAERVLSQGTVEYAERTFRSLLESGRIAAAAERLRLPGGTEIFHDAWRRSTTSTRLGLMLAAEHALEQDAASLDALVPGLCELLATDDAALRGDTADLLGKIGHPSAADALASLLDDPNPDVAEIAEEALAEVRKPRE